MMRKLLLSMLGAMLVPLAAYAGIYGTLTGKVTNEKGEPISGASIRLEGSDRGGYSRPDGKYSIIKINPKSYTVKVTAVGYQEFRAQVSISADQTAELNIKLTTQVVKSKELVITSDRQLVKKDDIGSKRGIDSKQLTQVARETVQESVLMVAGVQNGGTGFNIRGTRPTDSQMRIDGLDVGDQFSGGTGNTALANYPTVSSFATEEVQVLTGGFSAEYGNAIGGIVNSVTKTGRNDRYEGFLRYRTDLPSLFGSAKNGIQAMGKGQNNIDFGIGGPIPLMDKLTFYISGKYASDKYSGGLGVLDPIKNNLGQMPNSGTAVRNITGRLKMSLADNIRLEVGGTYGLTSQEDSGWDWLYANDLGAIPETANIPERQAKQQVLNQFLEQYSARMSHDLSPTSYYEVTASYNLNRSEYSKRKTFEDLGILSAYNVWYPVDGVIPGFVTESDKILDPYYNAQRDGVNVDRRDTSAYSVVNPLTGYIEGAENTTGTNNPYGIAGFFVTHGNPRSVDFRSSKYMQFDGNYNLNIEGKEFKHSFKVGFEFRTYKLARHNNSLQWDANPFYDVYTDEWGGNIYSTDDATHALTSKPIEPMEGAVYVQDQIEFKGIIISPGLRIDFLNPNSKYRSEATSEFLNIQDQLNENYSSLFPEADSKIRVSPRLNVSYPITDRSVFSLAYGIFFQRATFNNLYDAFNTSRLRGNQIIGNPNLNPQYTKAYQVGYNAQITDDFAFDLTAYYKDMFNLVGVTYLPPAGLNPTGVTIYSVAEYGNSRGLEITLRKRPTNNVGFSVSYAFARARGTASNATSNYNLVVLSGEDPFTNQKRSFPLTEYDLSFDRRHRMNANLSFVWGKDEGPSIGGLKVIENTNLTFSALFQTGTPYTKTDIKGTQLGEYNGERQPSVWNVDMRLEREFGLKDVLGDSFGDSKFSFFVDVTNLLNRTEPIALYAGTADPDDDGNYYRQPIGNFPAGDYYKTYNPNSALSYASNQYDSFGQRLYNKNADINGDGVTTQQERYTAYKRYVVDAQAKKGNYQYPRQVYFGFMLRF